MTYSSQMFNQLIKSKFGRTITHQLLKELTTHNGGFTKFTIRCCGEAWPPVSGWKQRALGRKFKRYSTKELIKLNPHLKQMIKAVSYAEVGATGAEDFRAD